MAPPAQSPKYLLLSTEVPENDVLKNEGKAEN